jgi:hypothetical protein
LTAGDSAEIAGLFEESDGGGGGGGGVSSDRSISMSSEESGSGVRKGKAMPRAV